MLVFHHIGLLVENIEQSVDQYAALFGGSSISECISVESQKVKVCFVRNSADTFIELVEPTDQDSVVFKLLKKRINYYHLAYKVIDIDAAVQKLLELNYKPMDFFNSEAFDGKRCIFLFSPEAHLVELIEE